MHSLGISKRTALMAGAAAAVLAGMAAIHTEEVRSATHSRDILYYRDPMHPAYRSEKPGIAPDCGMALEPVYAGGGSAAGGSADSRAGALQISAEKQQLIGMRTEEVRREAISRPLRLPARVVVEETRTYIINAPIDCWIRQAGDVTTGSMVKKGQKLGSFYSPDFLSAEQTYIFALTSAERQNMATAAAPDAARAAMPETPGQAPVDDRQPNIRQLSEGKRMLPMGAIQASNVQRFADALRNLGMDDLQLEELNQTRQAARDIFIYAPGDALVLSRSITTGQRFERGKEWYRLADIGTVWIVADVFENDARMLGNASHAAVRYQGRTFEPRTTSSEPVFDPATRTLKLRMAVANPGHILRPDMFVDLDLQVSHPPAITIPTEAISVGGLRDVVYLDRGNGFFEPRQVAIGERMGDRAVVESGLVPGDRIVVSGNFMLDSESRLQATAAAPSGAATASVGGPVPAAVGASDPVCGMRLGNAHSFTSRYQGRIYQFCSDRCKNKFHDAPATYTATTGRPDTETME